MAVNYDIRKGDTFETTLTIKNVDSTATDLTGATVKMVIVDRNGAELSETSQSSHDNPTGGVTTITIDKTVTATYPMGCFDFQTDVVLASGKEFTVEDGSINIRDAYDQ